MSISQRTTKLILATCLACLLAYFLNLSSAVSAGIIALLSLSDTRRSTLKLARNRLFSMLLALAIGCSSFSLERISYLESRPLSGLLRSFSLQDGLGNWHHTKHCFG
ncbi:integral membrane protein [Streptococcus pneumoniae]|nr:integral membrane protein [Streptococcus pneumoniae]